MTALKKIVLNLLLLPVVLCVWGWMLIRLRKVHRKQPNAYTDHPILIILSQVAWDDVWQRPQEFAQRAARAGRRVIFCSPVPAHTWQLTMRNTWNAIREPVKGLTVLSPLVFGAQHRNEKILRLNAMLVSGLLRPFLAHPFVIVANSPYMKPLADRLINASPSNHHSRLAFDIIDDFTAFDWSAPFAREMQDDLLSRADIVFTGTHELLEIARSKRADAEFIACGVDFDMFGTSQAKNLPADLAGIPHPIVGYTGSISERLDCELLTRIARELPNASLVMIGPVHPGTGEFPRGEKVHYLGLKPHSELPAYLRLFDVALIPFRINAATRKLNPVKTLEYLAAGVPVVSTPLPDVVRFFSDAVSIGKTHEEFIDNIRSSIVTPDVARRNRGFELARRSSWDEMTRRMLERIDQIIGAQGGELKSG